MLVALLRSDAVLLVLCGLALVWRIWLGTIYAGWEESDYGNLAMIEGVRAGHFLHYDMNHMPGYYAASALVHALVQNALWAGRAVSLAGGMGALAGSIWIARRLGGAGAGLLTACWLLVQPEFALYAASTLREPMYAAALVGFVMALILRRPLVAGLFGAIAFSVRFDAILILGAAACIHVWSERRPLGMLLRVLLPISVAAAGWSLYCRVDHGTFAFWSHAVAVNVETGLGAEAERPLDWALAGVEVSVQLLGWLLPWRIGWGVWLGALGALIATPWRRPGPLRTLSATALMATGFWGAVGFVGQHSPEHNLYWKWMMPLVPLLAPLSAVGWMVLVRRLAHKSALLTGVLVLVTAQATASHLKETHRQVSLSDELYAPQVAIGKWLEAEVPTDHTVLIDNIPACWLNRRPHDRTMISWFDVPVPSGDAEAMGRWLQSEQVPWLLWFREDWTQAPRIAPWLADGGVHRAGEVELVERSREDSYGWILYEVRGEGIPVYDGQAPPLVDLGSAAPSED